MTRCIGSNSPCRPGLHKIDRLGDWVKAGPTHTLCKHRSCKHRSSQCRAVSSTTTAPLPGVHAPQISLQQYDDCELLWLEYRHQLSISKTATLWILQDIQQGLLPCDADLLRDRAQAVAGLGQQRQVPGLDALRVLNSSRHALRYESENVYQATVRLLQLLPGSHPTQLLLDVLADLDLPPEILACQHQELDMAFQASIGCHVTPKAFHHLMQHWRQQAGQLPKQRPESGTQRTQLSNMSSQLTSQEQHQSPLQQEKQLEGPSVDSGDAAPSSDLKGGMQPEVGFVPQQVREQLITLKHLFGAEVVHAAVDNTPQLLSTAPARISANLQWLQHQLQQSPVAALLLAQAAGDALLLPVGVLEARYSNLCYLLQQLLGWRLQQVHTLLCNVPQLLACDSSRLASNWQRVQQLARRRSTWLQELAGGSQGLVAAVLCAEQRQLQQLRYAAEVRDLPRQGLLQVLKMDYVDFLRACPGFRVWRGMVAAEPQRWSLVEQGCIVHAGFAAGAEAGVLGHTHQHGKVLAVDERGRPVLIQLGELGPLDRLVG